MLSLVGWITFFPAFHWEVIQNVSKYTHLGHLISANLDDKDDIINNIILIRIFVFRILYTLSHHFPITSLSHFIHVHFRTFALLIVNVDEQRIDQNNLDHGIDRPPQDKKFTSVAGS